MNKKLFLSITLSFISLMTAALPVIACTNSVILGPLGPGLTYTDGSQPIQLIHKNVDTLMYTYLYKKGTTAIGGNYDGAFYQPGSFIYKYDFIGMGRQYDGNYSWNGSGNTPLESITAMNTQGVYFQNSNNPNNEGPNYPDVREAAAALSGNFDELVNYITPDSAYHHVGVTGYKTDATTLGFGYMALEKLVNVTASNPYFITYMYASTGKTLMQNTANWFHGDPNKFEARDAAYVWHRFNSESNGACMGVVKKKIMWCTSARADSSPFIPFDLNDPYVYPKFQSESAVTPNQKYSGSYAKYIESNPYTQAQIDTIEDAIMAPDGSVIGDVRDIQMRIAEKMPITAASVTVTPKVTNTPSVSPTGTLKLGDANNDGKVNGTDYSTWATNYTKSLSGRTNGDFNTDGVVNGIDYTIWINNYGK